LFICLFDYLASKASQDNKENQKMDKKIVCAMFITVAVFCMADGSDAAGKARIPKTGETANTYGAGSDGVLHKGVAWPNPRFTDNNGNGTVTDNLTGLIWLKDANCMATTPTWADALTWSNNLASPACGLTDGSVAGDWRLPSVTELSSLNDLSKSNPALPTGYATYFGNVQARWYWSSSTCAADANYAWYVYMDGGEVLYLSKDSNFYVWPVRGGQ
jgi:hypothetical protein